MGIIGNAYYYSCIVCYVNFYYLPILEIGIVYSMGTSTKIIVQRGLRAMLCITLD